MECREARSLESSLLEGAAFDTFVQWISDNAFDGDAKSRPAFVSLKGDTKVVTTPYSLCIRMRSLSRPVEAAIRSLEIDAASLVKQE